MEKYKFNTREDKVKALMYIAFPRAKAEEIVDSGRFDEVLQHEYRAFVTDPNGVADEERLADYFKDADRDPGL